MKKIRTKNNRKNNRMKRISMLVYWHRDFLICRDDCCGCGQVPGNRRCNGPGKEEASQIRGHVVSNRRCNAPENKKQAESAVRYWATGSVTPPEKKKQAKSVVRYRVSERRKSRKTSYLVILWHFLSYNNTDLKILMSRRSKS